jgi:hypothetical protein
VLRSGHQIAAPAPPNGDQNRDREVVGRQAGLSTQTRTPGRTRCRSACPFRSSGHRCLRRPKTEHSCREYGAVFERHRHRDRRRGGARREANQPTLQEQRQPLATALPGSVRRPQRRRGLRLLLLLTERWNLLACFVPVTKSPHTRGQLVTRTATERCRAASLESTGWPVTGPLISLGFLTGWPVHSNEDPRQGNRTVQGREQQAKCCRPRLPEHQQP